MRKVWRLLNLIFPSRCPSCGSPTDNLRYSPFCRGCWHALSTPSKSERCHCCGISLPSDFSFRCIGCIKERPYYRRIFAFGDYEGALKTAVNLLKFEKLRRLSVPLGRLIASLPLPEVDGVVPVPLSKKRLLQRGFNQSHLLCRTVSERLRKPLMEDLLLRTREIPPQSQLPRKERLRNPKGAFSVGPSNGKRLPGRVLLIDDVMTTGATINECARVLLGAGVKEVYGAVLARTRPE